MTGADDFDLAVTGRAIVRLGGPQALARVLRDAVEAAAEDEQARAHGMEAAAAGVLGDGDEDAAGAEKLVAAGVDLRHRQLVSGAAGVAEVGLVGRVVPRLHRAERHLVNPGLTARSGGLGLSLGY